MASIIEEVRDVLQQQIPIYDELLEIGIKKKVILVKTDTDALKEYTREENSLVGALQKLEKKRVELYNDICSITGKKAPINLKDIIATLDGQPIQKELSQVRETLITSMEKLKKINNQNQELLQTSIDYVEFSVNLLRDSTSQVYYDSTGNEINTLTNKMFDAKQ